MCKENKTVNLSKEIQHGLNMLLTKMEIQNFTIDASSGSNRGDNYLGLVTSVCVKGYNTNKENVTLHFIIKRAPTNEALRGFVPIRDLYGREIYMYDDVFPEFYKFQEGSGVLRPFQSLAKCYQTQFDNFNEALILENMKVLGFSLHNRHIPIDYNHVLLTFKEYGRYHALSYALRDQKPEIFYKIAENTPDIMFQNLSGPVLAKKHIADRMEKALKAIDPAKHKTAYERFNHFREDPLEIINGITEKDAAGKYAVINHGDCWMNNVLYKYGDPSNPTMPTDTCFLDFQLSRCGSPVLDLSYFIFVCTDKFLRDEHYEHLIREYYHSLSSFLYELGSDPEKLFPFEVLQQHLKKFSVFGLYMAVFILHLMTSEDDEIPDIHGDDVQESQQVHEMLLFSSRNEEQYHDRIRDVVLDFIKYGYDF